MGPEFQEVFNLNKGSIPVRIDVNLGKFDECAKVVGGLRRRATRAARCCLRSPTGMAVPSAVESAIKDVVSQFWNDDKMTAAAAMDKLAAAAKAK